MLRQLRALTLQWYVTREFIMLFFVTLLATTVLVLLLLAFQLVTEFEQMGVSLGQVLLLSPFIMPGAIVQALPPATMIASIMVFGRMSAENEILAAQSGGAPLRILALPLIFCGIIIFGSSLWIQDAGVRWGNNFIRTDVLKINQPDFFKNIDKPGSSMSLQTDATTTVHINMLPIKKNEQGKEVRPIQIIFFQSGKLGQTIFAEDHKFLPPPPPVAGQPATDRTLLVRLTDVQDYSDHVSYADTIDIGMALPDIGAMFFSRGLAKSWMENKENAERLARDEHLRWEFLLRRAADYGALAAAGSMLDPTAPALVSNAWNASKQHTEAIVGTGGEHDRFKVEVIEFHRKVALSLLPIAMIFLGIGLGLLVKKSNRMIGFLTGVGLYCMLYIPLTIVAKSLSSSARLGPYAWAAQYIPSMLFFSVGMALWFGYERGHITGLPVVLRPSTYINLDKVAGAFKWLYGLALKIIGIPVKLFSRTADRYVASTFLAPLIVIVFCIGGFITAIDVIEHHTEIVDGIVRADEPLGTLPVRSQGQAFADLLAYYAIQALEITLDILPLEVLMAGMLCAMVLVRNQEHLILKSSGMRLQRALLPVMVLTLLASLGVSAVRQFAMPALVMQRDWLRPQIYHRSPQSSAFALYTFDDKNKPLLFAVSQYESATQSGRDLRIYMLGDQKNKRIPTFSTDVFKWDGQAWQFWTDPVAQAQALLAAKSFGGGGAPKSGTDSKKKPGAVQVTSAFKPGGVYSVTEGLVAPGEIASRAVDAEVLRATVTHKSQVNSWKGPINPNFIDSERLGARVMRLEELDALSAYKPALKVDWYRRISECLMGLFLLWCALPLMFNDSTGSPVKAIAMSVLFAAVYWGLCEFAASKARANLLPAWAPLMPHASFCLLGIWQFFKRLQT